MRRDRLNRWPDRSERRDVYVHDLRSLAEKAHLEDELLDLLSAEDPIGNAWLVAKDWAIDIRYSTKFPSARALDMVSAKDSEGLLAWLLQK